MFKNKLSKMQAVKIKVNKVLLPNPKLKRRQNFKTNKTTKSSLKVRSNSLNQKKKKLNMMMKLETRAS